MNLLITCKFSGTPLGVLATAYPGQFQNLVSVHPFFSDSLTSAATILSEAWKADVLETLESRTAFLATIHKLAHIQQDFPGLPSAALVTQYTPELLTLVDWKLRLPQIFYPSLHISQANAGLDCLENWILTSADVRDANKAKLAEAEAKWLEDMEKSRMALALNGKPSLARLYSWLFQLLQSTPYAPDAHGWLKTLFLAKDSNTILQFDRQEIHLACEILESVLPLGSGLGPSVRARLKVLTSTIGSYYLELDEVEADFEEDQLATEKRAQQRQTTLARVTENVSLVPPSRADFKDQVSYLVAHAKWTLACKVNKRTN